VGGEEAASTTIKRLLCNRTFARNYTEVRNALDGWETAMDEIVALGSARGRPVFSQAIKAVLDVYEARQRANESKRNWDLL